MIKTKSAWKRSLLLMLIAVLLVGMTPIIPNSGSQVYGESVWEEQEEMALVVTGDAVVKQPVAQDRDDIPDVQDSLSNEKAYTMAELKAMEQVERNFSAKNSAGTLFQQLVKGIDLESILALSGFNPEEQKDVRVNTLSYARNGSVYDSKMEEYGNNPRYYYKDLAELGESDEAGELAKPVLAFKVAEKSTEAGEKDQIPDSADLEDIQVKDIPRLYVGQLNRGDKNNSLSNKNVHYVMAGEEVKENSVNIFGESLTRAKLMKMDRVTYTYNYQTSGEPGNDKVRGVALVDLLSLAGEDVKDNYIVTISPADDMPDGKFSTKTTVGEIKNGENHYILAYEYFDSEEGKWVPTYDSSRKGDIFGAMKLYGGLADDGSGLYQQPNKMIVNMSISEPAGEKNSPFKHMTYHGEGELSPHFAPDAITSATLTVEGPGLDGTTPVLMRELEETDDSNIWRGDFTDDRGTYTYEGVKVTSLIEGSVNKQIARVNDDIKVVFKNRWRQNIAEISYAEMLAAKTPVILAWGISDGTTTAPFVFDGSPILNVEPYKSLGIDDGCLKLIFDKEDSALSEIVGPDKFKSVAYVYVENLAGSPGYKHTKSANEAYNNPANTQYIVSFVGSVLGREINFTVEELEDMVAYKDGTNELSEGGLGHRAEYNLSNTTYWYVNEYEGIKLWDLLTTKLGVDKAQYENDDSTLVSFAAWDHYQTTASFSMKQLANPEQFYFYEKSPLDMGTDRPTKGQLATEEYHPDNQIGNWVKDHNGYPIKKGYPVVLAYGVNGYPYVKSSNMDGYAGGLKNDGGPLKVIFAKTDNMNRTNPDAIDNYAYFYNNGSNQLQRVQEIFVGDRIRYNTHFDNPTYKSMAGVEDSLVVEVIQADGTKETTSFTLKELEELLYGEGVRPVDRQARQEKANYFYKVAGNGAKIQDIFEGVNLEYLLFEAVGMQGALGTVSFYSDDVMQGDPILLKDVDFSGYNSENGMEGLKTMVAFAKNGYPLVAGSGDTGYVDKDSITGRTIKNSDGPLMLVTPQTEEEKNNETLNPLASVRNLNKIVVNLEKDNYAHAGETYGSYGEQEVNFVGGVKGDSVKLKVSDIEKAQKYLVTDNYTVDGKQDKYRGIDLKGLLFSSNVGASSLLSEVIVKNEAGDEYRISASDLTGGVSGKPIILAYGIGNPKTDALPADGKPLVPNTDSTGYDSDYENIGGPLRLLVNNGGKKDCIENVAEIQVEIAEVDGWTHSFGVYADYADMPALRVSGSEASRTMDFTVAELENLPSTYRIFDEYKMGNNVFIQGIDLWKFIDEYVGIKDGKTFTGITVYSDDNWATSFDATQVRNGVNGKPMVIAYGSGTSSDNGLPLVGGDDQTDIKPGYDPNIGNAFGPLRIIVNDNTGWCAKWLNNIVIGTGSHEQPEAKSGVFTVSGNELAVPKSYTVSELSALGEKNVEYTHSTDVTDAATGVLLKDLLADVGAYGEQFIYNVKTTDNTTNAAYLNITKEDIERDNYLLAYKVNGEEILDEDKAGAEAIFRVYRNFDDGGSWRNRLTSVVGIEAIDQLSGNVVFSISVDGDMVSEFTRDELTKITATEVSKTFGGDEVVGIELKELFTSVGLVNDASKLSVKDGTGTITDLDDVSIKDVENYFLAWKVNGSFIADKVGEEVYALRIYADEKTEPYKGIVSAEVQPVYNWEYNMLGSLLPASVRNVVADEEGGYWIGTTSGLFYMDNSGNVSKPYTKGNGKLTVDYVMDVAPDAKGGLWISQGWTYNPADSNYGMVYIDAEGNSHSYTSENTEGKLPHDYVQAIEVDADGNVWIGSFGGLTKFNPDKGEWQTWTDKEGLPAISVNTVVLDEQGGVWIGCYPNGEEGGLQPPFNGGYAYLSADGQLKSWFYDANKNTELNKHLLGDFWARGIAVDAAGGAWIARSGAAPMYFNNEGYYNIGIEECVGGRLDYVSPDKKTVTSYTGRELIEAINKGIFAADPDSDDPILKNGATPEIRAVAVDGKNGLWLGTSGLGVFHITNLGEVEGHYYSKHFDWESNATDNIYFLDVLPNGTVISGSNFGLAMRQFAETVGEAGLKSLTVDTGDISPNFSTDIVNYFLSVGAETDSVTFDAKALSLGSKISFNGKTEPTVAIEGEETAVEIKVISAGKEKVYNVTILKQVDATASEPIDATDANKPISVKATENGVYLQTNAGESEIAILPAVAAETAVRNGTAELLIAQGTKVTGHPHWDGKLYLPSVLTNNSVSVSGAKSVDRVVSVGSSEGGLTFEGPFRLLLPDMGGKSLGFIPVGESEIIPITYAMSADSMTALPEGENLGHILVDNTDLAIWSRNAGTFVAYTKDSGSGIPQEQYALIIDGPGAKSEKGYTIEQLRSWKGMFTGYYRWLNNWDTRGGESHTGIILSDLLEASGLANNAKSITVSASDFHRNFNLDDGEFGVNKVYPNNLHMILEIKPDGSLQLIVPQEHDDSVNRPNWVSDIERITVNVEEVEPGTGSTGKGEGGPSVDDPEEETPVTDDVTATVKADTTVKKGIASSQVSQSGINNALKKIKEKSDTQAGIKGIVSVDAKSDGKEDVTKAEVGIPMASVKAMAEEDNVSAVINTDISQITVDPSLLDNLKENSGRLLKIEVEKIDNSQLSDEAKSVAGDKDAFAIKVSIDGKEISDLGGKTVKAATPYKKSSQETDSGIIAIYLDGPNKGAPVKLSMYSPQNEEMLIRTPDMNLYSLVHREVTFGDVANHWAKEGIDFLATREILKGKGANNFDPEGSVTRAEFVTMLANSIDGLDIAGLGSAGFDDVMAGAWYTDYINWAVSNDIVSGYGDGKFGPNDRITREQMAVMTDNFIKAMSANLDVIKNKMEFKDGAQISDWSKVAVNRVQQYGIINGNPDGSFAPKGTATRAQAAIILKGYIESILR